MLQGLRLVEQSSFFPLSPAIMDMFKKKTGATSAPVPPVSNTPSQRLLTVEVIEARNLIPSTKQGDADPNLSIFLADLGQREIKAESFKTKPQPKTLAPKWFENFSCGELFCFVRTCPPTSHDPLPQLLQINFLVQERNIIWTAMASCQV